MVATTKQGELNNYPDKQDYHKSKKHFTSLYNIIMEFEEIIKKQILIDIDTAPNIDEIYSGICLVANYEIVLLVHINFEIEEFDGFVIIKNKDFERYRTWEEDDFSDLKNDNSRQIIDTIDVSTFVDLESSLKSLTSELVEIYTYDDNDENTFSVGKVLAVNNDSVEVHLMDDEAQWSDVEVIEFNDISCIGFKTLYLQELKKYLVE